MTDPQILTREASELGWKPGYRPYCFEINYVIFDLRRTIFRNDNPDEEVIGWEYINRYDPSRTEQIRITLTVYND